MNYRGAELKIVAAVLEAPGKQRGCRHRLDPQ